VRDQSQAVFLSYASQDAQAAQRICDSLRAAGVEVWHDQSELRGGDVWDRNIRHEIQNCALFMPIISHHSQERLEGYFRLEWKLAVDRSHLMAIERTFLVPVIVDGTREPDAVVPDVFRAVQWMRLPNGETPPAFVERIRRLLSLAPSSKTGNPASAQSGTTGIVRAPTQKPRSQKRGLFVAAAVMALGAVAYFAIQKPWISTAAVSSPTVAAGASPEVFNPPQHSIAVLPFVNMSGDKEQQYFSDGLTEEILNSLSQINQLQVAARTSSFSFQGEHPDIARVAHKLNVGAVLEGSARRAGNTVRITAQLINAVTGFHLWSQTYDRDLRDVLKLQTEIATAVASALKVTLLGDEAAKIELGGTRNPAAFDAYLRGSKAYTNRSASSLATAISAFTEAIRLDPNYALAFAGRSHARSNYYVEGFAPDTAVRETFDGAQADARRAIKLAPELAEGHLALAQFFDGSLDFTHANEEFERALALAPGNAAVLSEGGRFAVYMGRFDAGVAASQRAVTLDPLNPRRHAVLGQSLHLAHRYHEAVAAFREVISLDPDHKTVYAMRGLAYYGLGDFQNARLSCESVPDHWLSEQCLGVVYDKLGRHSDADAELAKLKSTMGDSAAYQYATLYAQWGDHAKALQWLDTAMRMRDPGLVNLKADSLMDPLRQEQRFQAVLQELKFPTD
jgi:TolB-like protein/Flp pilus assembly protein TadD